MKNKVFKRDPAPRLLLFDKIAYKNAGKKAPIYFKFAFYTSRDIKIGALKDLNDESIISK